MKKIGIITFHNAYNCGSMMESYAIYNYIKDKKVPVEIIDFSNQNQRDLYSVFYKNNSIKNVIKNLLILPHKKRIEKNNKKYEQFKNEYFELSKKYSNKDELKEDKYSVVVAGSDQIWNTKISDGDIAYFLPWVKRAKKIAYAPSFGAKKIEKNNPEYELYKNTLNSFDALSIRENNGRAWLKELTSKDVPVLIDPTLLYDSGKYEKLIDKTFVVPSQYIFFYCPSFFKNVNKLVKKISKKYKMPVITWSTKNYYKNFIYLNGFKVAESESPNIYLSLIKNASLVITTSFHGTIFSTIFRKNFWVIKHGDMFNTDDRVITLLNELGIEERLIPYEFNDGFDYLEKCDYSKYEKRLPKLRKEAEQYIMNNIIGNYEKNK